MISFDGDLTIDAVSTSTAEAGTYVDKNGNSAQSTAKQVSEAKVYNMRYDGPTEFTANYDIELDKDKSVDLAKSKVTFTTVNYTSRTKVKRAKGSITEADEAKLKSEGKSLVRTDYNDYIFTKPRVVQSDFATLPITITQVALDKSDFLESFTFESNEWYPRDAALGDVLINKGLSGTINIKQGMGHFVSKYQSPYNGTVSTYTVNGTIKK